MSSKITKKQLPKLKENLLSAVDPTSQQELTEMNAGFNAMLEEFDATADQMGIIAFLEGRIAQTTEALSKAEEKGASEQDKSFAITFIKTDQLCLASFQIIDAMVKANEQFGQAVFSYASAMDLDEFFEEVENKYGDEIAQEVYERSKKEQIPAKDILQLIIKEKSLKQAQPNEENSQASINKNPSSGDFLTPPLQM